MALVLANRVQETATVNTTVSFTLTGAVTGFQTFAVIGNTNTTYYAATDTAGNWEVGLGQYSTTGPTLTRLTFYASSAGGGPASFPGTVNVFVTYPSGSSVYLDFSSNVSPLGTISSGNWQASTIGVAYGGTGVTASSGPNSVVLRDANQNITVNRVNQSNTSTTAAGGTTALTAASSYIHTLIGTGGQTYTMPDATTLTTGVAFVFNNMATGTLTLQNFAAGAIGTIPAGGAGAVFLTDNSTTGGTWDIHAYLPEGVTFGTNAFNLGTSVISGGTWNGGTIQPDYGGTGLTTFTGANRALYSTGATTLTAGTLPVAAGGTGLSTIASTRIPYATATDTLGTSSSLTFNGTLLSTGAILATNASGILTRAAAFQDGVQIFGRAGGVGNFEVSITPTTLSADRTLTLPDNSGTVLTTGATVTVSQGGTGLSSYTTNRIPYATSTSTLGTSSGLTFDGSTFASSNISSTGTLTVTGAVTFNASSSAIQISPSQLTTTITMGGPSGTGAITLGRSTGSQTTYIQAGGTASGFTKTISFGTNGLSGSTTTIEIGSTFGTTVTANGTWNYTGAITSTNASGILTRAAATQDGVQIIGRAGGSSSYEVTITPTTLTADRTLTLPDETGTVLTTGSPFMINSTTVSNNATIASGTNAQSVGPVTINSGITVTVASGQRWLVV